jgi:hypothetical protein
MARAEPWFGFARRAMSLGDAMIPGQARSNTPAFRRANRHLVHRGDSSPVRRGRVGTRDVRVVGGRPFLVERSHHDHELFPDATCVIGAPAAGPYVVGVPSS